jgi:ribosome-associated toxin RatA of RatAB toxin-antitoxin module
MKSITQGDAAVLRNLLQDAEQFPKFIAWCARTEWANEPGLAEYATAFATSSAQSPTSLVGCS